MGNPSTRQRFRLLSLLFLLGPGVTGVVSAGLNRWTTYAGGLTDVNVILTVTDTMTGLVKTYVNPQGTAFQPIQDTSAFATCP